MKAPESLETLLDFGIIQEVVRPLMSGKEAQVYVVLAGGEECVAKVYKEANQRTFKHRSAYTEGRRTRNTRDQRAMSKHTQHGRKKDEDAWRSTEVEMIYRLRDAGVRVPEPINFVEGVLVMELVKDAEGHAAPRLGDLTFSPTEAYEIYQELLREVVRMLCAGVIHGDLSDFNVLMSHEGPVVIDFPQAVDPTQNPNAKKLLLRDVENLNRFLARFAPDQPARRYGEEIWSLFEKNRLQPDTKLSGRFVGPIGKANTQEVMALIEDADRERRLRGGERDSDELEEFGTPAPFRTVVDFSRESAPRRSAKKSGGKIQRRRPAVGRRASASNEPVPPSGPAADRAGKGDEGPQKSGRRRRTGKSIPDSARRTSKRAPRSGTPTADAAEPAGSKPRRRSRRGRARGGASADRTQAAGKTGTEATGKVSSERRPGRRAESPRSSGKARASSTRAGTDRPPRARRSRRRKASSPK